MPIYVAIAVLSVGATLLSCWVVLRLFPRLGLMDRPHLYGHDRPPVPYSAGILFVAVLALVIAFFLPDQTKAWVLLAAAALVSIVSLVDDRIGIHPFIRLCVQGGTALVLFFTGFRVATLTHPFTGGTLELGLVPVTVEIGGYALVFSLVSLAITVAWIVIFMNTLNWLDGVPGMVSGISTVAFLTIFLLSLGLSLRSGGGVGADEIANARLVAQLALAGAAITGVFLAFDLPPPRMLMGDAGTMVLGLLIASMAIYAGSKVATTFLVLGFPIMDAVFVVIRRVWNGQSPMRGDRNHFHHRLLRIGFSERLSVLVMCGICALFGSFALLVGSIGKVAMISILIILSILIEWGVWQREKAMGKVRVV